MFSIGEYGSWILFDEYSWPSVYLCYVNICHVFVQLIGVMARYWVDWSLIWCSTVCSFCSLPDFFSVLSYGSVVSKKNRFLQSISCGFNVYFNQFCGNVLSDYWEYFFIMVHHFYSRPKIRCGVHCSRLMSNGKSELQKTMVGIPLGPRSHFWKNRVIICCRFCSLLVCLFRK